MTFRYVRTIACCALGLLLGAFGFVSAEVSGDRQGPVRVNTMIMDIVGITDGADPIPQVTWEPHRQLSPDQMLNPSGAIRLDGRPDVAWRHGNGWPVVVWAYNNGVDHDIALAEWNGIGWSAVQFLTTTTAEELDPRVFVQPDGTVRVVWWVEDVEPHIMMATRSPLSVWDMPAAVLAVGETGRRPSVAVTPGGAVLIAFERDPADEGTTNGEIVVGVSGVAGFVAERVYASGRADAQEPVIHADAGRVWVDWKNATDQFAFAQLQNAAWGSITMRPWNDESWVGVETARKQIRRAIVTQAVPSSP